MKLEFNHLKRCRVFVTHEIADKGPIIADGLGTCAVGNTGSLYDCGITLIHAAGHGIYEADCHLV
jgi:hypothetical protein